MNSLEDIAFSFISNRLVSIAVTVGLLVILLIYLYKRAGGISTLRQRFWRKISGKQSIIDKQIIESLNQTSDVEAFNFTFGLNAKSHKEIKRLQTWEKHHDIETLELQRASRWVDLGTVNILKSVPNGYKYWCAIGSIIGVALWIPFLIAFSLDQALFVTRTTNEWFRVSTSNGQISVGIFSNRIFDCNIGSSEPETKPKFNEVEASAICASIQDGSLLKIAKNTIALQNIVTGIFGAIGLLFFYRGLRSIAQLQMHSQLLTRLKTRTEPSKAATPRVRKKPLNGKATEARSKNAQRLAGSKTPVDSA
jgi:Family of unknown function (DUF6216)